MYSQAFAMNQGYRTLLPAFSPNLRERINRSAVRGFCDKSHQEAKTSLLDSGRSTGGSFWFSGMVQRTTGTLWRAAIFSIFLTFFSKNLLTFSPGMYTGALMYDERIRAIQRCDTKRYRYTHELIITGSCMPSLAPVMTITRSGSYWTISLATSMMR